MEIFWTGRYILENYPIQEFQLFDLLKAGVQAVTFDGKNVVDRDPLTGKEFTLEQLKQDHWRREQLRRGTEETGKVIIKGQLWGQRETEPQLSHDDTDRNAQSEWEELPKNKWTDPPGCKSVSFSFEYDNKGRFAAILEAMTFRYESEGVKKYMGDRRITPSESSLSTTSPQEQPEKHNETAETTDDYIKRRREEGACNGELAWNLRDQEGKFKLTDLEITRRLGLDAGYQPTQIDAMKKRARRLWQKWQIDHFKNK